MLVVKELEVNLATSSTRPSRKKPTPAPRKCLPQLGTKSIGPSFGCQQTANHRLGDHYLTPSRSEKNIIIVDLTVYSLSGHKMLLVWDIDAEEIVQVDRNHLGDLQQKNVTIESKWLLALEQYKKDQASKDFYKTDAG